MSGYRLPPSSRKPVRIISSRNITFTFDGKTYHGYEGDTLASALLASGVKIFGRSFKYHRKRGLFSAGCEEPCALVTLHSGARTEPNIRATEIEIHDGLVAKSQNRWPSLAFDVMALNQLAGNAFSAGFYYKTFMGPNIWGNKTTAVWWIFEKLIRRAAGLGKGTMLHDPDHYERMNAWCDVLIVGSGPAGLSAAKSAAENGARVILCEAQPVFGGALTSATEIIDSKPANEWCREVLTDLANNPNVTLLNRTTVQSYYDDNTFNAIELVADHDGAATPHVPRQRSWIIRAKSSVIATGALERPMVFPGNDRPGIMLADAARRYGVEFGVAAGKSIAVFTNNDTAYYSARDLANAGASITAIIDVRTDISSRAKSIAEEIGCELISRTAVVDTEGRNGVTAAHIGRYHQSEKKSSSAFRKIECDCLAVSGGWSPAFHLTSQSGGAPKFDEKLQSFLPGEPLQEWHGAGAMMGEFGLQQSLNSGIKAATAALRACGFTVNHDTAPDVEGDRVDMRPAAVFEIRPIRKQAKSFVDLQHDVTAEDIRLAHREGFVSVEHLKRYTTLGMATDQGKTSNITGLAIMAAASGKSIPDTGTTRFRPPYTPVTLGALAGESYGEFKPHRLTPMHDWHVENRAHMYANGLWMRAESYNLPGETVEQAYVREAVAVRQSVGMVDVSTLGKIDIQGPDALEFINRMYSNGFAKLPVGKARYGLMLREDGFLFDDGTTWRLSDNHLLMTTTTANAGPVMQHLEYHVDCVWPELKVSLVSVSDEWAGVALAGPNARKVLQACVSRTRLDNDNLPFMGVRHAMLGDIPVIIARLSFSGELAYEVYCGAQYGQAMWDQLMSAGEAFNIVPYGLETLSALRIEKGHVAGPELNGRTTAADLGLGGMVSSKKPFIGSVLAQREAMTESGRRQLVGLKSLNGEKVRGGSHLVNSESANTPCTSLGNVTSWCFSPQMNCYIALALLVDGKSRIGEKLYAASPVRGTHVPVEIVSPHMVDPDGGRMHV